MNDYEMGWNAALQTAMSLLGSPILRRDVKLAELADELKRLQVSDPPVDFGHRNHCEHGALLADHCSRCVPE